MTKKKTTTPTNKDNTAAKAKPAKGKKSKPITISASDETADSETSPAKGSNATIGEALAAKGVKPVDPVQIVNFERRLKHSLSAAELTDRAVRVGELRTLKKEQEESLEREKEEWKKRKETIETEIEDTEKEIAKVTDEIGGQCVWLETRCQRVYDYRLMQVREMRIDTSPPQLIHAPRAMTPKEAQDGYTNADGKRTPVAEVPAAVEPSEPVESEQEPDEDDGSGIVEDDYETKGDGEKTEDLNARPQDFE